MWGWDFGDNSTVIVHVRRLREKVEQDPSDPRLVVTVRGVGYRFDPSAHPSQVAAASADAEPGEEVVRPDRRQGGPG